MAVLSATGVEAESDLAFAGLHELLRPILDHLGELPDIQSQALAGALVLAPSTHADRLLISAAVLGLLAAAAEDRPTLCVVDDAQWLDRPTADALVFTARRLRAERLVILFGAREGEATRFEAADLAELMLTGLADQPASTLLASRARQAPPRVRDRLLAEAAGNPLALMELASGLSDEQLQGLVPLPEAMPLTPRLEDVFRQRIEQLPSAAQTALLIAAADSASEVPAVLRAAAALQLPAHALDPAQHAALIRGHRRHNHLPPSAGALGAVPGSHARRAPAGACGAGECPVWRGEHRPARPAPGDGHANRRRGGRRGAGCLRPPGTVAGRPRLRGNRVLAGRRAEHRSNPPGAADRCGRAAGPV